MGKLFGPIAGAALALSMGLPAGAQADRCTANTLSVDGMTVQARFCVTPSAGAPSVVVSENFAAAGRSMSHSVSLSIVSGADVSRTIDDVDLGAIGLKRSLHMTLAYQRGEVKLEHALAIPGAIPVK